MLRQDERKHDESRTEDEAGEPGCEPGDAGERGLSEIDGIDEPALRERMCARRGERSEEPPSTVKTASRRPSAAPTRQPAPVRLTGRSSNI